MSTFVDQIIACPGCGVRRNYEVCASFKVDRAPHLIDAILDRTFQRSQCATCGAALLIEQEMSILDFDEGWILFIYPLEDEPDWALWEATSAAAYEQAMGSGAPPLAQALSEGFGVRTVFGFEAAREKLLCRRHALDDVALECLKLQLARTLEGLELTAQTRLRLERVDPDGLVFNLPTPGRRADREVAVPWASWMAVQSRPAGWAKVRAALTADTWVDTGRLLVPRRTGAEPAGGEASPRPADAPTQ